jgi:linoleate 10R-lipoxygenase
MTFMVSLLIDVSQAFRELDHEISPRGQGNVVSIEFNLLYRWHAAVSEPDTYWTEQRFSEFMKGADPRTVIYFSQVLYTH